jgi:hypothetical protein
MNINEEGNFLGSTYMFQYYMIRVNKMTGIRYKVVGTPTWQHISFLCHTTYSVAVSPHNPLSLPLTPLSALHSKPNPAFHHSTSTVGNHSTNHTYQLYQPTNGRTGRLAGAQNKRRPSK